MSTHKDQCYPVSTGNTSHLGNSQPVQTYVLFVQTLGNTSRLVCFHGSLRYSEQSLSLLTISPIEWSSRKYATLSIIQKIGILAQSFLWIPCLIHQDLSSPLVSWFNLRQVWQSCADILIVMPGRKEKSGPINGIEGCLGFIADEILRSFVGIISNFINHYKDTYSTTRIQWKVMLFFRFSRLNCSKRDVHGGFVIGKVVKQRGSPIPSHGNT